MMISPEGYVNLYKSKTYKELLKVRDELIDEIKDFEKNGGANQPLMCPSLDTVYQCNLLYLSKLCELIHEKYEEYTWEDDYIKIVVADIADMDTDCVVNAANERLQKGTGVCDAIFKGAGIEELEAACEQIGGCPTGSAVITPGFNLKAKYIIHAVGPIWSGSNHDKKLLRSSYKESLERAKEKDCHSIAFPLISSGAFDCPVKQAWEQAVKGCYEWIDENPDYSIQIVFAVRKDRVKETGDKVLYCFDR